MKQGRASVNVTAGTKVEPRSRAVNPAYAGTIGTMLGNHGDEGDMRPKVPQMYEGRGLSAPMAGCTTHKAGSQGKR